MTQRKNQRLSVFTTLAWTTNIGVTTHLAQHRRNGKSISSVFLSTWRSSMHSFWKSWQDAVVDNYPFAASWPVCSLLDPMVISILPALHNMQSVPSRRSKISVDTVSGKWACKMCAKAGRMRNDSRTLETSHRCEQCGVPLCHHMHGDRPCFIEWHS